MIKSKYSRMKPELLFNIKSSEIVWITGKDYSYLLPYSDGERLKMRYWIEENCKDFVIFTLGEFSNDTFYFKSKEELMGFKLAFS